VRPKSEISAYILRGSAAALLVSCVIVALSSAINLPNKHPKIPARDNDMAFGVSGHKSASLAIASALPREGTLTFADRVAYQRAIEEVYWQHRIWPTANAGRKPPLDRVMLHEAIEKKVEDYLRDSQALEDYWQRPITPDQLQAEMERLASHTKQPAVLRELYAALDNDPFVIAECLARPVLAERLITELYAHDQRFHGELKRCVEAELRMYGSAAQMKQTSGLYTEMEWIKGDNAYEEDGRDAERGVKLSSGDWDESAEKLAIMFGKDDPVGAGVSPAQPTRQPPQKLADTKSVGTVKMNASEWQDSVAKLAAQFGSQDTVRQAPRLPNEGLVAGAAALQKPPLPHIKTGVLSPLQEDDTHYYAVAITKKGKDRLKLATVAWLK
jgi:hypothetical protein